MAAREAVRAQGQETKPFAVSGSRLYTGQLRARSSAGEHVVDIDGVWVRSLSRPPFFRQKPLAPWNMRRLARVGAA